MKTISEATITTPNDNVIVITREFDAPRDLVFKAWTEPERDRLSSRSGAIAAADNRLYLLSQDGEVALLVPPTGNDFTFRAYQLPMAIFAAVAVAVVPLLAARGNIPRIPPRRAPAPGPEPVGEDAA